MRNFREFCIEKLKAAGKEANAMTFEFMSENIRQPFFPKKYTRDLMRLWNSKAKADRVEALELGTGGAHRKQGEHSVKRQHLGLGIREVKPETANRKSSLWMVFREVQTEFLKWRMSGQYVDRDDLLAEFDFRLSQKISALETQRQEQGFLSEKQTETLEFALRRKAAHQKSQKNQTKTVEQMQRLFRCRFLKPQRLIHLSLSQEKEGLLESWQFWDFVLWLFCSA